jgi:tetratricopeptide (TPR) repeat protein
MPLSNYNTRSKIKKAKQLIQANQLEKGRLLLLQVCRARGNEVEAWHLLAAVSGMLGLFPEAERCSRHVIQLAPEAFGAYLNLGNALMEQGKVDDAYASFQKALLLNPEDPGALNSIAKCCNRVEDFETAAKHGRKALRIEPGNADVLNSLGVSLQGMNRPEQALVHYQQALQISPHFTDALYNAGTALQKLYRFEEALSCYERVIALDPALIDAYLGMADIFRDRNEMDQAMACLQQALRIDRGNVKANAETGLIYESWNRLDEAAEAADLALSNNPNDAAANLLAARLDKRQKQYARAEDRLQRILKIERRFQAVAPMAVELGHVLDKMGEYSKAFEAFKTGKSAWRQVAEETGYNESELLDLIERCRVSFTAEKVDRWQKLAITDDYPTPVFFVGFPRSGTTLVEQVLAARDNVVTTDEQPLLPDLYKTLTSWDGYASYPECLEQLTSEEISRLRSIYWESALDTFGDVARKKLLVDKHPMNIVHLGLIHRIFPDAKIVVALRDPRDTCLSCFMQSFQINASMIHFLSLENTVRFYDSVMSLWIQYRSILPPIWLEYRYEDLVSDFSGTTRRLFSFLELEWSEDVALYHQNAKQRSIRTPSYQDVISPIYSRSIGRWKNYESYLIPLQSVLEPFISEFGYSEDGGIDNYSARQ